MLLDGGSFVSSTSSPRTAHGFAWKAKVAGDGVVEGFGEIDRRLVAIYTTRPSGGSLGEATAERSSKSRSSRRVPIIGVNDSGARIQEEWSRFRRIRRHLLPQRAVIRVIPH
jgi:acetyl-CoA carboxylase carboxyltransferase component